MIQGLHILYLPKELKISGRTKTYTWMFIAALFHHCQNLETTKMNSSSDDEWINLWYMLTMEYY